MVKIALRYLPKVTRVLTSYYNQEEWLNEQSELSGQSVSTPGSSSASRSKIWVERPDQESDNSETWQKLNGHGLYRFLFETQALERSARGRS